MSYGTTKAALQQLPQEREESCGATTWPRRC